MPLNPFDMPSVEEPAVENPFSDVGGIASPANPFDTPSTQERTKTEEDDPWFFTSEIKSEELEKIAQKYKVSAETLKLGADMNMAARKAGKENEPYSETARVLMSYGAGAINEAFGNLGWKAFSQIAYDENTRKALDEVKSLADKRRSYASAFAINLAPALVGGTAVKGVASAASVTSKAAKIGEAAAIGGAYGFGRSEEGSRVEDVAIGAVGGAVLGGAAMAIAPAAKVLGNIIKGAPDKAAAQSLLEKAQVAMERNSRVESEFKKVMSDSLDSETWVERVPVGLGREIIKDKTRYEAFINEAIDVAEKTGNLDRISLVSLDKQFTVQVVQEERKKLAKILAKEDVPEDKILSTFEEHTKRMTGREEIGNIIDSERKLQYVLDEVGKDRYGLAAKVSTEPYWIKLPTIQKITDVIDSKFGTDTKRWVIQAHRNLNEANSAQAELTIKMKPIVDRLLKEEEFQGSEGSKFVTKLVEIGKAERLKWVDEGRLSREQFDLVNEFADKYKELGDELQKRGMVFQRVLAPDGSPGYIHHKIMNKELARETVLDAWDRFGSELLNHDVRAIKFNPKTPAYVREKQLIKSFEIMTGDDIMDSDGLFKAYQKIKNNDSSLARSLGMAKATMERTGDIPDMIRHWDIAAGVNDYIHNSTRYLALREPFRELKNQVKILNKIGDTHYAGQLEDFMQYTLGAKEQSGASRLMDAWKSKQIRQIIALEKQKSDILDKALGTERVGTSVERSAAISSTKDIENQIAKLKFKHDIFDNTTFVARSIMFSNMLSGMKAPINDLLQPFTTGITAIGGKDGAARILKAYSQLIKDYKGLPHLRSELAEIGAIRKDYMQAHTSLGEDVNALSRGSEMLKRGVSKYAEIMNYLRTGSDLVNRKIMIDVGKGLATDFMSGKGKAFADAKNYIEHRAGIGVRTEIRRMQRAGQLTEENLGKMLGMELADSTQFIYSREMSSALARDWGSIMTQFTKYPSEVLGSMIAEHARHGSLSTMTKAAGPLLSLYAGGALYNAVKSEEGPSPREKHLLYSQGAMTRAPLASLPGLIPGTSPELSLWRDVADSLSSDKAQGKATKALRTVFDPTVGMSKFLGDLYTTVTGEEFSEED